MHSLPLMRCFGHVVKVEYEQDRNPPPHVRVHVRTQDALIGGTDHEWLQPDASDGVSHLLGRQPLARQSSGLGVPVSACRLRYLDRRGNPMMEELTGAIEERPQGARCACCRDPVLLLERDRVNAERKAKETRVLGRGKEEPPPFTRIGLKAGPSDNRLGKRLHYGEAKVGLGQSLGVRSATAALKQGDEVVTNSGILGTITGITEKIVTLEIDDKVRVKMLKTQVAQVLKGQNPLELVK